MIKIVEQSMLYDFYGELLTEHQKKIYEDVIFNDLSLSEIAMEAGITRQGVHDLVKRCDKILRGYEDKLHLVERFMSTRKEIEMVRQRLQTYQTSKEPALIEEVLTMTEKILQEI